MNADYITNPLYENNPFIEALPPMLAGKDLIRALASIPPYSDNDRDRSTGERLQLLSSLYEYYQPLYFMAGLFFPRFNLPYEPLHILCIIFQNQKVQLVFSPSKNVKSCWNFNSW